jgi:hypothetical protein
MDKPAMHLGDELATISGSGFMRLFLDFEAGRNLGAAATEVSGGPTV